MTESLFLDTDCLSTFLIVQRENLILQLYAGRIGIPQQVCGELKKVRFMKDRVDALLKANRVVLYQIDAGTDPGNLYLKLTTHPDKGYKIIGSGEAAAIVLAKECKGILGSNNMRDILPYIQLYNLQHRTSADIMAEALEQHLISEGQGNTIWRDMLQRNRKLPADTFTEFLASRK
jgi:predicted nucleic acid-binding protein